MILTHSSNDRHGTGERLEARKDRLNKTIKGLLFGLGVVFGAGIGFHLASTDFDFSAPWSPTISAGIAIVYLVAVLVGSRFLSRVTDEVERSQNYKATAFAGAVYMIGYPVWFLLWKGGFVVEPIHWLLFLVFWFSLAVGTIYYRYR